MSERKTSLLERCARAGEVLPIPQRSETPKFGCEQVVQDAAAAPQASQAWLPSRAKQVTGFLGALCLRCKTAVPRCRLASRRKQLEPLAQSSKPVQLERVHSIGSLLEEADSTRACQNTHDTPLLGYAVPTAFPRGAKKDMEDFAQLCRTKLPKQVDKD